jgi:hypothetical protein
MRADDHTETEGTSWFDPILPSMSRSWYWKLPRDFDKSNLGMDDKIIWDVFADNSPTRSGKVQANEIEYVKRTESLFRLVQVAIQRNQLLFGIVLFLLLYLLYNLLR